MQDRKQLRLPTKERITELLSFAVPDIIDRSALLFSTYVVAKCDGTLD